MFNSEIIEIYDKSQTLEINTAEIELLEIQQAFVLNQSSLSVSWQTITNGSPVIQMSVNKGYFIFNTVITNLVLPLEPSKGSVIEIYAGNETGFIINQNSHDQIQFGDKTTTLGITGQLANSSIGDHLKLIFLSDQWLVLSGSQGNYHLV